MYLSREVVTKLRDWDILFSISLSLWSKKSTDILYWEQVLKPENSYFKNPFYDEGKVLLAIFDIQYSFIFF